MAEFYMESVNLNLQKKFQVQGEGTLDEDIKKQ